MNIDKIIFAVDDNPRYAGLWEINSEICKKVLGITPVLFHITDEESDFYEDEFGIVKKIKKLNNYPSSFQSQIYRLYGTKYFKDQVCLVSDIDLLMVNKNYLINTVKNFNDDDFVIFSDDAYDPNRPECVGIYSYPRIYMCYNAAKGGVFNEILNTNRTFNSFADEVFKVCPHHHDCDEIYLGTKINFFENQSRIKRLKRGFTSPFICSNRIERPQNEDKFNQYDKCQILSNDLIDINLSRPYSKYKKEIDELKEIILNKNDEVYLIGCHIENNTQENYLRELTNVLEKNNKKFVLTSHTTIPTDIIKKSVGFIYDSDNPKYKTWNLKGFPKFVFQNENFNIESPYITYGASDYYHVGVIRLIINGIKYLQNTDFETIHWIEYDAIPDFEENKKLKVLLKENDFIFYGVGSKFSFNLSKVNPEFLKLKSHEIYVKLSENSFIAEKVISDNLTVGIKKTFYLNENDTNTWSRYSQNFNNQKINFSLFESEYNVDIFITNISNEIVNVLIEHKNENINLEIYPNVWFLKQICFINDVGDFKLSLIEKDNKIIIMDENLDDPKKYESIVKSVNFIGK